MTRARIGLMGYFGHGNYGDELFISVYKKYFFDCDLEIFNDNLQRSAEATRQFVDKVDLIIIGGGDLFIPKYFAANYFCDEFLRKPVYFHGVGVARWAGEDQAVIDKMSAYVSHPSVKAINSRDIESAEWITSKLHPAAAVTHNADMIFALDLPLCKRVPERRVFGLILRHATSVRWDNIRRLCDRALSLGYEIHNIVLGTGHIRDDDLKTLEEFTYDQARLIDPNNIAELTVAIGKCDAIASTKFHGCVVAAAYGIPAISLVTTDKFVNLYKAIDRRDLIGHFIHDDIHERLCKYMAPIPRLTRGFLRDDAHFGMLQLRHQCLDEVSCGF